MGDYEKAIPLLKAYLYGTKREQFRAFCGWKLGFAYWTIGNKVRLCCSCFLLLLVMFVFLKEEVESIYLNVIEKWAKDVESYDRFSSRKCQEYLDKKGFSKYEGR